MSSDDANNGAKKVTPNLPQPPSKSSQPEGKNSNGPATGKSKKAIRAPSRRQTPLIFPLASPAAIFVPPIVDTDNASSVLLHTIATATPTPSPTPTTAHTTPTTPPARKTIDIPEDPDRILDGLPMDLPYMSIGSSSDLSIGGRSIGSCDTHAGHSTFTMSLRSIDGSSNQQQPRKDANSSIKQVDQHKPKKQRHSTGGIRRNPGFEESETESEQKKNRKNKWI